MEVEHEFGQEKTNIGQFKRKLSLKFKCTRMLIIVIGFVASEGAYAAPVLSLIDLDIRTSSITEEVSLMFILRSAFGLLGSVCCAFVIDRVDLDIMLSVVEVVAGVVVIATPWWMHVEGLAAFIGITGICCAIVNIGTTCYCIRLWGMAHPQFLLLLTLFTSIMSFSVSSTVRSLLLPVNITAEPHLMSDNTTMIRNISANTTLNVFSATDVKVQYAFLIPGVLFLASFIGHALLAVTDRCCQKSLLDISDAVVHYVDYKYIEPITIGDTGSGNLYIDQTGSDVPYVDHPVSGPYETRAQTESPLAPGDPGKYVGLAPSSKIKTTLILLAMGVIAANIGTINISMSMHLPTFAVRHLYWSSDDTANTDIILGVSSIVSLVILLVLAMFVPAFVVMGILQAAILISAVLMSLPIASQLSVFYIALIFAGMSVKPSFPTMISWICEMFGMMNGKAISFYFVMLYVGELSVGTLLRYLVYTEGAVWFVYINLITAATAIIAYIITVKLMVIGPQTNTEAMTDI